ncbi:hypothetical protein GIB67_042959 [Kingdonia uniflora]|uniref:DUF4220 domain-containing protein n=1 Tax=Kingdonia uniflora TaxID=39325 RepID=A0A7J7L656_9MAGN|nr:hypothetical protein GIB67_042959 [Kingdonia uniflora]
MWEIRILVLISLFIQILQSIFGRIRKKNISTWISFLLWICYLLADWAATLALGILSRSEDKSSKSKDHHGNLNYDILAFWSPFLLLHLGGPDSVTAFSLEDNELWLIHILGLIFQVALAVYVFIKSLPDTIFWPPAIFIFIAGIVKYGERTWDLTSASREIFRSSMVPAPDPGPNYVKIMDEYSEKKDTGTAHIVLDNQLGSGRRDLERKEDLQGVEIISKAHEFFKTYKRLIVDLILTSNDRNHSRAFFMERSWKQAYAVIEIELEFIYEVLFTKAAVVYTVAGLILRILSIFSIFTAFALFWYLEKHSYSNTNVDITYVLLGGAIALEIGSLAQSVFSNWTITWLQSKRKKLTASNLFKFLSYWHSKTWSNSMAQYNLLSFCLNDKLPFILSIQKLKSLKELYDKYKYRTFVDVTDDLKEFIFKDLVSKVEDVHGNVSYKHFSTSRVQSTLRTLKGISYDKEIDHSADMEFDESILQWHIATDLCYYLDKKENEQSGSAFNEVDSDQRSIALSNYMLYLLVSCPFMLPSGIGQIRYGDTCAEVKVHKRLLQGQDVHGACEKLVEVNTDIPPRNVKGDKCKSVLFDAVRLAKSLRKLEIHKRWEVVNQLWVEVLHYAASNCRGNFHAQ